MQINGGVCCIFSMKKIQNILEKDKQCQTTTFLGMGNFQFFPRTRLSTRESINEEDIYIYL